MSVRVLIKTGLLILLVSSVVFAGEPRKTTEAGIRIGLFSNSTNTISNPNSPIRLFGNKTNLYAEAYVNYYLTDYLALVLNLGSYSKGDIRFDVYYNGVLDGSFLGSASIYPVQFGIKLSPFKDQLPLKSQLYIEGGGALIIGREQATVGPYNSIFAQYTDGSIGSETNFNWWAGGGAEIPITDKVLFDFMVKYIRTKFSGDIAGISDYSGVQVTFGFAYLSFHK